MLRLLTRRCLRGPVADVREPMNAKKKRTKQRRRARRLAEQAWDAADDGNLDLAVKIIRRATAAQADNPQLWHDRGVMLRMDGRDSEAEAAFRTSLSLAADFADAYAELAAVCVRSGRVEEAVTLQSQAVQHAPTNSNLRRKLESYQSLTPSPQPPSTTEHARKPDVETVVQQPDALIDPRSFDGLLSQLDWDVLESRLRQQGCALIPQLLDPAACATFRSWFSADAMFAKTVVMDRPEFGRGEYRYFRGPVPVPVNALRSAVYPHVAQIANRWQVLLRASSRFPPTWSQFRDECHRAGQSTPTPILLSYEAGGFNALHRDLRGEVYFPIQLAVVLSPRSDAPVPQSGAFRGGEFVFADSPERRKSRRHAISAGLGDAVLFCTRDRLVHIGGAYGLQSVKHGVNRIEAGTRLVLGLPFHEYR